jgi:hypothetical protein
MDCPAVWAVLYGRNTSANDCGSKRKARRLEQAVVKQRFKRGAHLFGADLESVQKCCHARYRAGPEVRCGRVGGLPKGTDQKLANSPVPDQPSSAGG